jgi:hypothetical protein
VLECLSKQTTHDAAYDVGSECNQEEVMGKVPKVLPIVTAILYNG